MIFKFTKDASDNFFNNILGLETKNCKTKKFVDFYCAKISIYKNDIKYDILIFLKKCTINLISNILLFEKNPNEQEMIDLLKEIANLIAGTAKTLIEEFDNKSIYELSTPEYLGKTKDIKNLNLLSYSAKKVNNRCFIIGIEEE